MDDTVVVSITMLTIGAVGTLALAVAAFITILWARSNQKSEHRQKLLNEIIKWAEDIVSCGFEGITWDTTFYGKGYSRDQIWKLEINGERNKLDAIYTRKIRVGVMASAFGGGLAHDVYEVSRCLYNHLRVYDLALKGKIKDRSSIGRHRIRLNSCASNFIEKATGERIKGVAKGKLDKPAS